MSVSAVHDPRLGRTLVLDELFDLALYRALRERASGRLAAILDELIHIETRHVAFWQEFFDLRLELLDLPRRLKLRLIVGLCRLFGAPAVLLVLEAIEVYGVRKYLAVWSRFRDQPLGEAVQAILIDEFKHEDAIVTEMAERRITPEQIRNIFLGLNDGLVEILGAVSGFFAAFGNSLLVLVAGSTAAAAGAISMAAGAYVALGSEQEVQRTTEAKARFLAQTPPAKGNLPTASESGGDPWRSAFVVGGSYLAGALFPLLPVLFGAGSALFSVLTAGTILVVVSMILAFLSGMDIKKRVLTNLAIMAGAVFITYLMGTVAKRLLGIEF